MQIHVIWFKLHWNLFRRIQWIICLHPARSPRWVLNVIYFKFLIINKISTKMSLRGNTPFHEFQHMPYWYHKYAYTNTIYLYRSTFYVEGNLYIHLTMPTCFMLLCLMHICIFQQWQNKDIYHHDHLWTHCDRLTHTCVRNLTIVGMLSVEYQFEFWIAGLLSVRIPVLC